MLNTLDKKRMTKICKDSSNKIKFPWYSHSFDDIGCYINVSQQYTLGIYLKLF